MPFSVQVEYNTSVGHADDYYAKGPWSLDVPANVSSECYDVILVDAPQGYRSDLPGGWVGAWLGGGCVPGWVGDVQAAGAIAIKVLVSNCPQVVHTSGACTFLCLRSQQGRRVVHGSWPMATPFPQPRIAFHLYCGT